MPFELETFGGIMSRTKKLAYNTITSLIYNIVVVICSFILPRYFLTHYGSSVNGLVRSISNFISFVSLFNMGVNAVVKSALYKPLAENDNAEVSRILKSAGNFFKLLAKLLGVYVFILIIAYPCIISEQFDFLYIASLFVILSIGTFVQYYFGVTRQLLLNSDQKAYIPFGLDILTVIANTAVSVLLISHDYSIHLVMLVTTLIFLSKPLFLVLYVKKHYSIDPDIELSEEPIKQKWNGLAQHISTVVMQRTDVIILTMFSTLKNVSIYSTYFMVIGGIKKLILSVTAGIELVIGDMLAKQEQKLLLKTFEIYEWIMHNVVTLLYTITAVLITDFIKVYTLSVDDANYILPVFAILLTAATALHGYRCPYSVVIHAAGHFKQTQKSAVIETVINIILSVLLVMKYGLIGVAIGTIVAMIYRTLYFVWYLSDNIINRPVKHYIQYVVIDGIIITAIYFATQSIAMNEITYYCWFIKALKVTAISAAISLLINIILKRKYIKNIKFLFGKKPEITLSNE